MENMLTENKHEDNRIRISETLIVGILLTMSGGFLDAYTYLYRGGVFSNGQTGNLVLLGIQLAEGDFQGASYYILPILSFLFGVFLAENIHRRMSRASYIKWRHIILILEILLLTVCMFIPAGSNRVANIIISFICALQTQAFRSLHGLSYISVMCTGNLRSGIQELCAYIHVQDRRHLVNFRHYFLIAGSFVAGALAGSLFNGILNGFSLILPITLLSIVLIMLFLKNQLLRLTDRFNLRWFDH